jgi:hypothetical protein
MGAWLGRRTEPRVDFREDVRVIWPGEVTGVLARGVNLSPTGILVDAPTPTPCPVGSDVLCDVSLPQGPRLLRGRVAHRRLLPSEKVGMGIEFVDLSPREAAELRDVVGESVEKPQRVKVRFKGTNHVVSARAFAVEGGFRLATALPFLEPDTEVDVALSPDASVTARGWVSRVSLEPAAPGGTPRLLIDVRVDAPAADDERTPVVEALVEAFEAVPEYVWEPDELGAISEQSELAEPAEPPAPVAVVEGDRTEIVTLDAPPTRWRALVGGMLAGVIAFAAFVVAIVVIKAKALPAATPSISPPVIVTQEAPPAEAPAAIGAATLEPPAATPDPAPAAAAEPVAAPDDEAASFAVLLSGSLAGAQRYPLRDPDGVAFNLPHARTPMKVGTYTPVVPGIKSMWVRALPGGGTHLRFFFAAARPAPRIVLERDGVRVTAR